MGLVAWDCTKIPTALCSTSLWTSIIIFLLFHSSHIKAARPGLDQGKANKGLHPEEDWRLEFVFCQALPDERTGTSPNFVDDFIS